MIENLNMFLKSEKGMKKYTGLFIIQAVICIFIPFYASDIGLTENPTSILLIIFMLYYLYHGSKAARILFIIANSFNIIFSFIIVSGVITGFLDNINSEKLIFFASLNAISILIIFFLIKIKYFYNNRKQYLSEKIHEMSEELKNLKHKENSTKENK